MNQICYSYCRLLVTVLKLQISVFQNCALFARMYINWLHVNRVYSGLVPRAFPSTRHRGPFWCVLENHTSPVKPNPMKQNASEEFASIFWPILATLIGQYTIEEWNCEFEFLTRLAPSVRIKAFEQSRATPKSCQAHDMFEFYYCD